ncbi:unnamed protein product [Rangifer tarandus platyrhynchus]|uniref:Uncharacterized protein n=2 Tax=Rangifer tarandus platyrhynchus TaxID=3082113 RepID=A0ABN8YPK2_RANTA|nr:unnamed protein product [Rangifer tarandus platyrhynchus]CAI9700751.1 unnamed protein product [Rangifer tarandus platyrhynchus]
MHDSRTVAATGSDSGSLRSEIDHSPHPSPATGDRENPSRQGIREPEAKAGSVPSIDTLRRPTANPLRSPRSWKVCGERSDLQRHSSFCRAAGARSKSGAEG